MTKRRGVALGCSIALVALGVVLLVVAASDDPSRVAGPREPPVRGPRERSNEPRKEDRPSARTPRPPLPANQDPASGPSIARVRIPSIDVNAPLIKLGLNPNGTLQVPASASRTGWWKGGAFPGEP